MCLNQKRKDNMKFYFPYLTVCYRDMGELALVRILMFC